MNGGRAYLHSLACARGIAAWMVVLFHARGAMPWLSDDVMRVLDKGYLAVDFFFILSGFVIYLSGHEALLERGVRAIPAFWRRRLARIYPLYAAMLAATVAFAALLTVTGRDHDGYPWAELPLHVAMLQNWGFTDTLSWNHPAWSISTEMAAYLLFPLLVLATPMARMPRGALLAGAVGMIAIMALWLHLAGQSNLGDDIPRYGLLRCLCEFSAGCLLCAFWLRGAEKRGKPFVIMAVLPAAAAAILWMGSAAAEPWAFPLIAGSLIVLLADLSRLLPPLLRWPLPMRALVYLGEISYATYLCHFMLFIWFKIALVDDAATVAPMKIMLFLALTLLVSILLHHMVERPGRRIFSPPVRPGEGKLAAARRSTVT